MVATTITPSTVIKALALGSLTYAAYETRRLVVTYPLHNGSSAPPSTAALWPLGLGDTFEVRTRAHIPRGADPRETFVRAFYQTWTLRLEGLLGRTFDTKSPYPAPENMPAGASAFALAAASATMPTSSSKGHPKQRLEADPDFAERPPAVPYTPPPTPATPATPTPASPDDSLPVEYASGLFRVIGRTPESTMVWWMLDANSGGGQLLTATRVQPTAENTKVEEVQISFACAETDFLGEDIMGWIGVKFHRMYMRFLLDRAARRMDAWARKAERHT